MRFSGNALTLRGARGDRTRSWPWRSQLGPSSTGSHESGDSGVVCTSDSAVLFLLSSHPYAGPKLFKEPSAKSNKHIIQNALAHCCLAGKVNEGQKKKILEVRVCGGGGGAGAGCTRSPHGPFPGEGLASQRRATGPALLLDCLGLGHFQMRFWTRVRIKNCKSAPCPDSLVHVSWAQVT